MTKTHDIDIKAAERELCRRSFSHFIRRAWKHIIPDRYIHNWHVDAIAEHFEAVADGQITRLLVNVPPGTSKSTITGIMYPAWLWGPKGQPEHKFIGAAHEQGLAVRDSRMMRELVTSEWFQSLWPLKLAGDQNEKLFFENEKRGFRQACAVASMTGRRAHTIAWDDALNPEKAHSDTHRETAIRILRETLPTRLSDPEKSAIIIVMQRLHENDPSGYLLSYDSGYEHLCLPMEFDPSRRCITSLGWQDPRTEEGELLFPGRFPREVVDRDKTAMGEYATAGQFQQLPSPLGGGIFKDEWWQYYTVLPKIKYRMIYADTAQKTKEQNDFSVFQCWGKGDDGRIYLLDMVRGKWEAPELLVTAKAFWDKHKAEPRTMGILRQFKPEDKSSGTGLIQQLAKHRVPVVGIQRGTDKVTRSMDVVPQIQAGNVMLPESAPWLSDLLSEATGFPNATHDDILDPLMDAITDMLIINQRPSYADIL